MCKADVCRKHAAQSWAALALISIKVYSGPQNQDRISAMFKVDFAPFILVG
jgi:hypothetical protein